MLILPRDTIHIWRIELADPHPASSLLLPDERTRAERLKIPLVRSRFIATRTALREILSQYTDVPPADLNFIYNSDGKPALADSPFHFNLTHSDDHALLAVAHTPIGIDLERVRPLDGLDYIMRTAFTSEERAALEALSEERKILAFFRLWTCKEALMKALGGGFRLANSFSITLNEGQSPQPHGYSAWTLTELTVWQGYKAALATQLQQPQFIFLDYS